MRLLLMIGATVALAILAACGGGDGGKAESDLLHLRGYDITEDDWRVYVRGRLLGPGATNFCEGLQGLSAEEVGETIVTVGTPEPGWTPPPGGIPLARETSVPNDRERAAEIIQEECERILP